MHLIEAIGKLDEATVSDIAGQLGITLASVTNAVNKLNQRGYILKEKNPLDGRSVHVSLTKAGQRVFRLHKYFHRRMIMAITKDMAGDEREMLLLCITKLNEFFKESAEPRRNMR